MGNRVKLTFDLGEKGFVTGVGPFIARKVARGQFSVTSFGSLQTGNPNDSGDWGWNGATAG